MSLSAASVTASRETLLATLVQLEQRARNSSDELALGFLMVNDTHALVPYRQAVLWQGSEDGQGNGKLCALSGLAVPDVDAPFNLWLVRVLAGHARQADGREAGILSPPADAESATTWAEYLPAHAWWLPLDLREPDAPESDAPPAALVLWRDAPLNPAETHLLGLLGDAYAHAWRALRRPAAQRRHWLAAWRSGTTVQRRRRWMIAAAVAAIILLFPVRQSVLAPAEVVARTPAVVRAPLQGVVDRIAVQPNQLVQAGDLLATLDARELQGKLESARQGQAVAQAELRQGQQQALFDERSKAGVALLQGKEAQAASDTDYLEQSLARTQLHAERAGIALFDDPADWIGKPVALGERIMMIADPHDAELEIQLPVADAIALPPQAEIQLFLNAQPASPIEARLLRVGYRAAPTADGGMAYRVRATFVGKEQPEVLRVGLKGTAKLYGERTLLISYLLRKPLATLRVWLGL